MDLSEILKEDLKRYNECKSRPSGFLRTYFTHPGFRFSFWFRLANCQVAHQYKALHKILTFMVLRCSERTGIQIAVGASISAGLYIPHYGGIVVNPMAVVGRNCYLSNNVLIGKVHAGRRAGVPVLGDDVFIGVGAVLLGGIRVGDGAVVGANSVVLDDVPRGCMVAGSPARVVSDSNSHRILGR